MRLYDLDRAKDLGFLLAALKALDHCKYVCADNVFMRGCELLAKSARNLNQTLNDEIIDEGKAQQKETNVANEKMKEVLPFDGV